MIQDGKGIQRKGLPDESDDRGKASAVRDTVKAGQGTRAEWRCERDPAGRSRCRGRWQLRREPPESERNRHHWRWRYSTSSKLVIPEWPVNSMHRQWDASSIGAIAGMENDHVAKKQAPLIDPFSNAAGTAIHRCSIRNRRARCTRGRTAHASYPVAHSLDVGTSTRGHDSNAIKRRESGPTLASCSRAVSLTTAGDTRTLDAHPPPPPSARRTVATGGAAAATARRCRPRAPTTRGRGGGGVCPPRRRRPPATAAPVGGRAAGGTSTGPPPTVARPRCRPRSGGRTRQRGRLRRPRRRRLRLRFGKRNRVPRRRHRRRPVAVAVADAPTRKVDVQLLRGGGSNDAEDTERDAEREGARTARRRGQRGPHPHDRGTGGRQGKHQQGKKKPW